MGRPARDLPRQRGVLRVAAGREQRPDQGRAPGDSGQPGAAATALPGDSQVRAAFRFRRGDAGKRIQKFPPVDRQVRHAFRRDLPEDVLSEGLYALSKELLHEVSAHFSRRNRTP